MSGCRGVGRERKVRDEPDHVALAGCATEDIGEHGAGERMRSTAVVVSVGTVASVAMCRHASKAAARGSVDQIALVTVEPDAREQARRGDAFPLRARDAQVDHRELDLVVLAGRER